MISMPIMRATRPGTRSRFSGAARFGLAAAALLVCLILVFASGAGAYTVERQPNAPVTDLFTISPTSIEIEMEPGETVFQEITLANRTGDTLEVDFSAEDFTGSDDPAVSTVLLGTQASPQGARDWLDPEVGSLVIDHGDTITMRVGITAPQNAEPGGHYTTFLASFSSRVNTPEGGVNVVSRLGCFFLVRIAGPVTEAGTLEKPEVPGLVAGSGSVPLGLVFNNEGNIHLKPSGTVIIRNILGMKVAEIPVSEWIVMPNSSRRAEARWDNRFLLGLYTVEAAISYGSGPQQVLASSRFWGFSWPVILIAAFIVLALLILVIWIRRRRAYYGPEEYEEEYDEDEDAGAGAAEAAAFTQEPPAAVPPVTLEEAPPEPETAAGQTKMVPLNELFPSMEDTRLIDISDDETHHLVNMLIEDELEMARTLMASGHREDARGMLLELRAAAQRMGFLGHVVDIDELLSLSG